MLNELAETELVRLVVDEDDRAAFAELIERNKRGVFALITRLLGPIDEVEDIAQNVFIAAYRGLPAFKQNAKFSTWIFRIAYNQSCSALRRIHSRRKKEMPESSGLEVERIPEFVDQNATTQEKKVLHRQVWKAVEKLPTQSRAVIELFYGNGLSYPELADVLELPLGTIKTHLHRAREGLREMLVEKRETKKE